MNEHGGGKTYMVRGTELTKILESEWEVCGMPGRCLTIVKQA
jgi:hypothetical protein